MWKWPEKEWGCHLVSLLSGKTLEAYTAMEENQAHAVRTWEQHCWLTSTKQTGTGSNADGKAFAPTYQYSKTC